MIPDPCRGPTGTPRRWVKNSSSQLKKTCLSCSVRFAQSISVCSVIDLNSWSCGVGDFGDMIGDRLGAGAGASVGRLETGAETGFVERFGIGGEGWVVRKGTLDGGGWGERNGGGGGEDTSGLDDTGETEARRVGNGGGSNVLVLRGRGEVPARGPRLGKGGMAVDPILVVRPSVAGPAEPDPIDDPVRLGGGGRGASTVGLLFGLALGGGGGGGAPLYGSQFVFFIGTLSFHFRQMFHEIALHFVRTWYYDLGNLGLFQPPNWPF